MNQLRELPRLGLNSAISEHAKALLAEELTRFRYAIELHNQSGEPDDRLRDIDYLVRLAYTKERRESFKQFRDMAILARCGWFIDGNMLVSSLPQMADYIRGNHSPDQCGSHIQDPDLDRYMEEYLEDNYEQISGSIERAFPSRAKNIQSALLAFEAKQYDLCIPALILQADGAFRDSTGASLFSSNQGSMECDYRILLQNVEADNDDYAMLEWHQCVALLFHAVRSTNCPFNESVKGKSIDTIASFNRHAILHGIINDYDTKVNSLRYFNLLGALASCLPASRILDRERGEAAPSDS